MGKRGGECPNQSLQNCVPYPSCPILSAQAGQFPAPPHQPQHPSPPRLLALSPSTAPSQGRGEAAPDLRLAWEQETSPLHRVGCRIPPSPAQPKWGTSRRSKPVPPPSAPAGPPRCEHYALTRGIPANPYPRFPTEGAAAPAPLPPAAGAGEAASPRPRCRPPTPPLRAPARPRASPRHYTRRPGRRGGLGHTPNPAGAEGACGSRYRGQYRLPLLPPALTFAL